MFLHTGILVESITLFVEDDEVIFWSITVGLDSYHWIHKTESMV